MTPFDGFEREKVRPATPERPEENQRKGVAYEKPKQDTFQAFVRRLDQSDIAPDLKEIIDGWLQRNLNGEAGNAYLNTVRERGKSLSLGQMLEAVADVYLANRPDAADKYKKREISGPELIDTMLSNLFDTVLDNIDAPEQRSRIQKLIARVQLLFKQS